MNSAHATGSFVSVADETKALFIRQPNGGFARAGGSGRHIQFAAESPNTCVAVTDGSSDPLAVQLLTLFDPATDLEAWVERSHGRNEPVDLEGHSFKPSRSYTFRVPIDAAVEPKDAVSEEWSNGRERWIRIPDGWPCDLRILLDGVELFAGCKLHLEPNDSPRWVDSIVVRPSDVDWDGGSFRLRVSMPPSVRLIGARVFGKAIPFADPIGNTFQSAPLPLELNDMTGAMDVRISAVSGDDHLVIRRNVDIPLDGLVLNRKGVWQRHSPSEDLNVGEIRRLPCVVHVSRRRGRSTV